MTTISPIRYEVEIQEPLSAPVPMPPSMSSSEALVIWMLRIAMKAPIMHASTAIQSFMLARGGDATKGPAGAVMLMLDMLQALPGGCSALAGDAFRRFGVDGRGHRHAGAQVARI